MMAEESYPNSTYPTAPLSHITTLRSRVYIHQLDQLLLDIGTKRKTMSFRLTDQSLVRYKRPGMIGSDSSPQISFRCDERPANLSVMFGKLPHLWDIAPFLQLRCKLKIRKITIHSCQGNWTDKHGVLSSPAPWELEIRSFTQKQHGDSRCRLMGLPW